MSTNFYVSSLALLHTECRILAFYLFVRHRLAEMYAEMRRLTYKYGDTIKQRMIHRGRVDERLSHAYIGQPLILATSEGVATLVSWLIYKYSDPVEQRMTHAWRQ